MKPMNKNTKNSCINDFDPSALDEVTAVKQILKSIAKIKESETINIMDSLGRVSSKNIKSSIDIPSFRNSAMDGYALLSADLSVTSSRSFQVIGTAFAGKPFSGRCQKNQCVRIMTGAMLPQDTDTIVIQEDVNVLDAEHVEVTEEGQHHD